MTSPALTARVADYSDYISMSALVKWRKATKKTRGFLRKARARRKRIDAIAIRWYRFDAPEADGGI